MIYAEHALLLLGVMILAASIVTATGRIAAAVISGIARNVQIK